VENPNAVESELTAFVKGVARGRFDYDIVTYVIDTAAIRTSSAMPSSGGSAAPPRAAAPPISVPRIWGPPSPWSWFIPPWAGPYYDRSLPSVVLVSQRMQLARAPIEPATTAPAAHPSQTHAPRGEPKSAPRSGGGGSSEVHGGGKVKA
jgi:hypothetical protein